MAVAPSFQKLDLVGEPFTENNRQYICVRYPDGHTRKVRWYDTEPAAAPSKASGLKKLHTSQSSCGIYNLVLVETTLIRDRYHL